MKERGIIGQGHEHTVFESRSDSFLVLKKPRPATRAIVAALGGHEIIKKEFNDAVNLAELNG